MTQSLSHTSRRDHCAAQMRSSISTCIALLAVSAILATAAAQSSKMVYLIRHGEKPADGGDDLTPAGYQRAACIAPFFGSSDFNIQHIFACDDTTSRRMVETVTPLAQLLNLTIDTSIGEQDPDGLAAAIAALPDTVQVPWRVNPSPLYMSLVMSINHLWIQI